MKYAFTTTLCDNYINGFFITFYSLLKTTKDFNYDLIVFEWGTLSDENKIKIKKLYNNVIFKKINTTDYNKCFFDTNIRNWEQFNPSYRFDIFTLSEYQKIIYFDCDIIFEIDMNILLKDKKIFFGASKMEDSKPYHQTLNKDVFNAGLLVIDNCYLNNDIKNDLINICTSNPPKNTIDGEKNWVGNQPILNNYFSNKVNWIEEKYNLMINRIDNKCFTQKNNYHITGKNKPWMSDKIYNQFDSHVFYSLMNRENSNRITCSVLLKKIIKKYEDLKKEITNIYE
jgi:lipopolysaccharide biosynthesis glycosyltransferase